MSRTCPWCKVIDIAENAAARVRTQRPIRIRKRPGCKSVSLLVDAILARLQALYFLTVSRFILHTSMAWQISMHEALVETLEMV